MTPGRDAARDGGGCGPAQGSRADTAGWGRPLGFVLIGVFARSDDGGPALVAGSPHPLEARSLSGHAPLPRPAMEDRPGVIEIDLADGTRLRVDAFVNERAWRRVLAVLRAS